MKTQILSTAHVAGALPGSEDAFTPIGFGLEVAIPKEAKSGDFWELSITPLKVNENLAHTHLGGDVFVSNNQELLSQIKGNLLQTGVQENSTHDWKDTSRSLINHRSTKIATYFNHIFIAHGKTLWWTDLDNYWNWYPATDSEADFRILDWEKDNITALCLLNEILYIHFPHTIYECTYVGKPTIVRLLNRVTGAGAISSRACVSTKNAMFFLGVENFYIWSPDVGLKEIGQEVWKKFTEQAVDITTTWAYHDKRNNEICWVNNNIAWAFNYIEGHWAKYSTNSALDHTTALWHRDFNNIATAETSLTIEPDHWAGIENLWVGCFGVARDARYGDGLGERLPLETPFLETDDVTYGDIHSYKTTDLVVVDAEVEEPWVGVKVLVGGKKRVTEATTWQDCGVWDESMEHKDFVAVAGKVLRFRFELVHDLICADGSMTANGGQQLTGKRVDLYDGHVKLDGSKTLHEASYYENVASGRDWFCEIYAWGERVNLPDRLVGPDK